MVLSMLTKETEIVPSRSKLLGLNVWVPSEMAVQGSANDQEQLDYSSCKTCSIGRPQLCRVLCKVAESKVLGGCGLHSCCSAAASNKQQERAAGVTSLHTQQFAAEQGAWFLPLPPALQLLN